MEFEDYYQTLGVARTATDKEIRAAFRRLARRWHPDSRPDDPAGAKRFQQVAEAYEVLSNPEKRRKYDTFGAAWREAGEGPGPSSTGTGDAPQRMRVEDLAPDGESDPLADLLGGLFGAHGGRPHPVLSVEITLEEALRGTTRTVVSDGGPSNRLEVRIPAGVATGDRLAVPGAAGRGRIAELEIRVRPHPRFTRSGDDLRCRVEMPLWTLLLGGEVDVGTLSDHVALRVPAETADGGVLRLRGQGMPRRAAPGGRGDLYVEVHALLPKGLREEERQLVRRLAAMRAASGSGSGRRDSA
jgi:DnaJ-class molecular chaperone